MDKKQHAGKLLCQRDDGDLVTRLNHNPIFSLEGLGKPDENQQWHDWNTTANPFRILLWYYHDQNSKQIELLLKQHLSPEPTKTQSVSPKQLTWRIFGGQSWQGWLANVDRKTFFFSFATHCLFYPVVWLWFGDFESWIPIKWGSQSKFLQREPAFIYRFVASSFPSNSGLWSRVESRTEILLGW